MTKAFESLQFLVMHLEEGGTLADFESNPRVKMSIAEHRLAVQYIARAKVQLRTDSLGQKETCLFRIARRKRHKSSPDFR